MTVLAHRAITGQPDTRAALLAAALPYALRVSRRLANNEADAEEIAQESLYVMLTQLQQFEGRCLFETWLFAVIRSQVSRKYRRIRARPMSSLIHVADPSDAGAFEHAAEAHPDAEEALRVLSPIDRDILLGRDLDGMSSEEVATRVHLSVAAVKSRLHRARARVRDHFEGGHASPA
jgi:RNA polymerase sigma factor (sigma-70 family)